MYVVFVSMSWHVIPYSLQEVKMMSFWLIINWLVSASPCSPERSRWSSFPPSSGEGRRRDRGQAGHQWSMNLSVKAMPWSFGENLRFPWQTLNMEVPGRWLSLSPPHLGQLSLCIRLCPLCTWQHTSGWVVSRVKDERKLQVQPFSPGQSLPLWSHM